MATDADEGRCVVCGDPLTPATSAECNWCDGRYHLNQRNDIEGRDCGAVWIDEQYLALQFGCQRCIDDEMAPKPPGAPLRREPSRSAAPRPRRYRRRA